MPAEETGRKRSDKPPPRQSQQAGEKRSTKRPPQEGVRLEAMENSSRKGPPNQRLKEAQELREAEERSRQPPALVLQAAHPFGDVAPEQTGQK